MAEVITISREAFGDEWIDGREFTPEKAWLDLIQLADLTGVLPVVSYTERWFWKNTEVGDFFTALRRHGHIRPHDKSRWRLCYQAQDVGLVDEYEVVWRIYPKRVAKQKGYHAYAATRKGRKGKKPVSARALFEATLSYAKARGDEDKQFILDPSTFFGPDERWKEKATRRTNSKAKGSQWKRPMKRDLTKTPEAQTKGRSPTKTPPKKTTAKKKKGKDPLADL